MANSSRYIKPEFTPSDEKRAVSLLAHSEMSHEAIAKRFGVKRSKILEIDEEKQIRIYEIRNGARTAKWRQNPKFQI